MAWYEGNETNLWNFTRSNQTLLARNGDSSNTPDHLQNVIQVLVGIVCGVGITGNGLNFYLMVQRTLRCSIRREKGVYIGFACLALSDILCCVFILPRVFIPAKKASFPTYSFSLVYQQYGHACLYVFVLCSTWITVQLAISRTLVVCDPFRKRGAFCMKGRWTVAICMVILAASCLFSIPAFMTFRLFPFEFRGKSGYLLMTRDFVTGRVMVVHNWFRFLFGYAVPFIIMLICNICLVVTLRRSEKMRAGMPQAAGGSKRKSGNRITLTLVAIILAYIFLMTPSEILDFIFDSLNLKHKASVYAIVRPFANLAQTSNFALNFALHLGINTVCRNALRELLCFTKCWRKKGRPLHSKRSFALSSVSATSGHSTYIDKRLSSNAKIGFDT